MAISVSTIALADLQSIDFTHLYLKDEWWQHYKLSLTVIYFKYHYNTM